MEETQFIIDIEDYRGKRIIFTHEKWEIKKVIHPELRKRVFLKNIEKTIIDPEEVWEDYEDKKRKRCYYKKYSINDYVKVVIWIADNPCKVITAYSIDRIKERGYAKLKQIR